MHSRRDFLKFVGLAVSGLCFKSSLASDVKNVNNNQLNILLITADDMAYDTPGCFGGNIPNVTPNLDRLAGQGMIFKKAHVNVAVCTPSRSVIQTGRYQHNNGVMEFQLIDNKVPTLTECLNDAGYLNGIIGKATIGGHGPNFENFGDTYKGHWDYLIAGDIDNNFGRNPQLFYEQSNEFFKKANSLGKPFFLMANSHDPHRPFFGSEKEKKNWWIAKSNPAPSKIFTEEEIKVPPFLPDLPEIKKELAQYYSSSRRCDDSIGQVLKSLDDNGLTENTLVMFLSDNGMAFPFAKTNCYLFSTRTPWIIRLPGKIEPGSINESDFISTVDYMPTVLDAVGVKKPEGMDGRSFLPLLKGKPQFDRDAVFTQYNAGSGYVNYNGHGPYRFFTMRCIQTERFGYIFNPWAVTDRHFHTDTHHGLTFSAMKKAAEKDPQLKARISMLMQRTLEEFYDFKNDPAARRNLINDSVYFEKINELRNRLKNWMIETNDPALKAFEQRADVNELEKFMSKQESSSNEYWKGRIAEYKNTIINWENKSSTGIFNIKFKKKADLRVVVRSWGGKTVFDSRTLKDDRLVVDISNYPKGEYIMVLWINEKNLVKKISYQ
ncbi:sulfatase family protein [Sedimentisphaera salicampi]|uniref:sulfatase family protein n=1 Tax=Sedimentisphaera salicampi TaxID=1941349 RepID=UPI000B9BC5DC|nr:sulfatase [Sedimentisphaera salicampi]OXU15304.1 Arylsulfatase [Sedimentisphaera salicampi]